VLFYELPLDQIIRIRYSKQLKQLHRELIQKRPISQQLSQGHPAA